MDHSHEVHPSFISVTVSVLSIEGTDCRLDELGRLADRTGGKVRSVVMCVNICHIFILSTSIFIHYVCHSLDLVICVFVP